MSPQLLPASTRSVRPSTSRLFAPTIALGTVSTLVSSRWLAPVVSSSMVSARPSTSQTSAQRNSSKSSRTACCLPWTETPSPVGVHVCIFLPPPTSSCAPSRPDRTEEEREDGGGEPVNLTILSCLRYIHSTHLHQLSSSGLVGKSDIGDVIDS